jgi:hypothetical protein
MKACRKTLKAEILLIGSFIVASLVLAHMLEGTTLDTAFSATSFNEPAYNRSSVRLDRGLAVGREAGKGFRSRRHLS